MSNLTNADFRDADLSNASLWFCNLTNAKFLGANMTGTLLADTYLWKLDFREMDLKKVHLEGSKTARKGGDTVGFDRSDMRGATLTEVEWEDVSLVEVNLENAELGRSSGFFRCKFNKNSFRGASFGDSSFIGAEFANSDFSNSNMVSASFAYADLQDVNLKGADLGYSDFTEANLRGADLTGAILDEANFTGADLTDAIGLPDDFEIA